MNIAVGFGCLVVFGLLMEANGFTEQQQLMEQQRKHRHVGGITKCPCKILGGKCQSVEEKCNGTSHTGKIYCKHQKKNECCVPPPPSGCVFGYTVYPNGAFIEDTCMVLQCCAGAWNFTGEIQHDCGKCEVFGDPHIIPYDYITYSYQFNGTGTYVASQPGLNIPAEFGVNMKFVKCYWEGANYTCVRMAKYYEPGIEIMVILSPRDLSEHCRDSSDPANDPLCAIKVLVNEQNRTIDESVSSFYATDGTVMVFEHNHIDNDGNNRYCINIVGSKGFSVSVCQHFEDYPYVYVWAMPSLKDKLYGLCDKFTGGDLVNYTLQTGTTTLDAQILVPTWKFSYARYCDCSYRWGGCVISEAAPPYYACDCSYMGFWTCTGRVVCCLFCKLPTCAHPDKSIQSCLQGGGNCGGY